MSNNMDHMTYIDGVARADCDALRRKEATYQGSWKRRGGVGAFMMLARKIDRLETILATPSYKYDVFSAITVDPSGDDGTVLAEVRDLRRYLLLVEAEMAARGVIDLKPASGDTAFKGEVDPTDVYSILAAFWDLDREAAKKRALQLSYGGSPEDGGHHERMPMYMGPTVGLSELWQLEDGVTERPPWPHMAFAQGNMTWYLVDRRKFAPTDTDHLPRLQVEMNAHEYRTKCPAWYQVLYQWSEGDNKWKLLALYVEMWGV